MQSLKSLFFIAKCTVVIGLLSLGIEGNCADSEEEFTNSSTNEQTSGILNDGLVEVEPTYVIPSDIGGGFTLLPYTQRRGPKGSLVGVSYSMFQPTNYVPDQNLGSYNEVYGSAGGPLIEFDYTAKNNYSWGSLGLDVAVGMYSAEASGTTSSKLSLTAVQVGGVIALDNMGDEPIWAPYAGGGGYIIKYKEQQASSSFNGTTQVAPYFMAGCLVQLDWLDRNSATESYIEGGIENTFLFVEGRKFFSSAEKVDPNFETDFHVNLGFKMEM